MATLTAPRVLRPSTPDTGAVARGASGAPLSPEYLRLFRAVQEAGNVLGSLDGLTALSEVEAARRALLRREVAQLRRRGVIWSAIGEALRLSKSTACRTFGRAA